MGHWGVYQWPVWERDGGDRTVRVLVVDLGAKTSVWVK